MGTEKKMCLRQAIGFVFFGLSRIVRPNRISDLTAFHPKNDHFPLQHSKFFFDGIHPPCSGQRIKKYTVKYPR